MINYEGNILTKTRAEEHEADVWGEFFIPPYFNKLELHSATKSTYIVGKRGCGKTMLLKYLDYHTAFSKKRAQILPSEVRHIGIYWRVDTQFCNSLNHRGLDEHQWIEIFESYFSIVVGIEILKSINEVARSAFNDFSVDDFDQYEINSANDFYGEFPTKVPALLAFLEAKRRRLSSWISNIISTQKPILPPGKTFLDSLIADIRRHNALKDAAFYVYVDEVENLVPYQRRILNSYLKHSQRPFIVSFTSKELSNETATTGPESINATHDFRLIQLDELASEADYKTFFAEVLLANLEIAGKSNDSNFLSCLRAPDLLSERSKEDYRSKIGKTIRMRFPEKSTRDIAADAISTDRIFNILKDRIKKALSSHRTKLVVADFMRFVEVPDALIITPALLSRRRSDPNEILNFLINYSASKTAKSDPKGWIHNNLVGSLLEIYRPHGLICPIYSGYNTFFTMANKNLRHFLILCYKALEIADLTDESNKTISLGTQARAAYEAADQLIREIKTFGPQGERLRTFVLRLGNVFRMLQAAPPMSEPEQNQFSINSGSRVLSDEETIFISELKKYGILSEELETKTKGVVGSDIADYQLNPIYSPYFQISYRRKRKISLSVEDFSLLALGTEDSYREFSSRIQRKYQDTETMQAELWK